MFTDQAGRLNAVLQQQMTALKKYIKSPPGEALRRSAQNAVNTVTLPKPPIHLLLGILEELRILKYTDKATKVRVLPSCYAALFHSNPSLTLPSRSQNRFVSHLKSQFLLQHFQITHTKLSLPWICRWLTAK
jgi:hypothetical protein